MTPALETWLTRFAAGAGTMFEWYLTNARCLRAAGLVDGRTMCPLYGQYIVEYGIPANALEISTLTDEALLSPRDIQRVMYAADDIIGPRDDGLKAIRGRLLHICRVGETKP